MSCIIRSPFLSRPASHALLAVALALIIGPRAVAALIPEVEPNDFKLIAQPIALTASGDVITGNSTGNFQAPPGPDTRDHFLLTTPSSPLGIYRNRITLTSSTPGHTGALRGLEQLSTGPQGTSHGPGVPGSDIDRLVQDTAASTTPPRFNQFYTFGHAASIYYSVVGTETTTEDYAATYTASPVTPVHLGAFAPGQITLTNLGLNSTRSTEVIVYDGDTYTAIPGYLNDNAAPGTTIPPGSSALNSLLVRDYLPGNYLVAISSDGNTADHQFSPPDEQSATLNVFDYPGIMMNSSRTTRADGFPFRIVDANGAFDFTVFKPGPYDIAFFTFTVVPEPGFACAGLLLGLAALHRMRTR